MNKVLLKILVVLIFLPLPLELLGIKEVITRFIIDAIIVFLFLFGKKNSLTIKFIIPVLFSSLISFIISDFNILLYLIFLRRLILPLLFFTFILNNKISIKEKSSIFNLIFVLSIFQIFVAFLKLFLIGVQEDYSGTFSSSNGSISTIFPLMAISFILPKYLISKKYKYLIFILLFALIGYIGNKLAIFPYIILLSLILIIHFQILVRDKHKKIKFKLSQFLILGFLTVSIIYFVFAFSPRLRENENIVGFDKNYAFDFISNYESRDFESDDGINRAGRTSSIPMILDFMSNKSLPELIFGIGPGDIVKTSLVDGQENKLQYQYELGYGSRLGIWWVYIQIGIVGLVTFIFLQIKIYSLLLKKLKKANNNKELLYGFFGLGIYLVYQLDFFTYSSTLIENNSMSTLYFLIIGLILGKNKLKWKVKE